ncbi:hypothetical protein [Roseimicrobium sp. ORNL1]|nr:hypothetical protein [Roseimicrobium sp. ORNL1]QIF04620.1 hypothetical protein G5S37_24855 [Roseimicrobium sp. ORNL1]
MDFKFFYGPYGRDQVTLVREGKSFAVPMARLAPESQALARKLAGGNVVP